MKDKAQQIAVAFEASAGFTPLWSYVTFAALLLGIIFAFSIHLIGNKMNTSKTEEQIKEFINAIGLILIFISLTFIYISFTSIN